MVDWSKPSSADKDPVENSSNSSLIVCNSYKKPKLSSVDKGLVDNSAINSKIVCNHFKKPKPSSADKGLVDNSANNSKIVCNHYKKPKPSSADKSPIDNSANSFKIVCNRYKNPEPSSVDRDTVGNSANSSKIICNTYKNPEPSSVARDPDDNSANSPKIVCNSYKKPKPSLADKSPVVNSFNSSKSIRNSCKKSKPSLVDEDPVISSSNSSKSVLSNNKSSILFSVNNGSVVKSVDSSKRVLNCYKNSKPSPMDEDPVVDPVNSPNSVKNRYRNSRPTKVNTNLTQVPNPAIKKTIGCLDSKSLSTVKPEHISETVKHYPSEEVILSKSQLEVTRKAFPQQDPVNSKLPPLDTQIGMNANVFKSETIPVELCSISLHKDTEQIDSKLEQIDSQPAIDPNSLKTIIQEEDLNGQFQLKNNLSEKFVISPDPYSYRDTDIFYLLKGMKCYLVSNQILLLEYTYTQTASVASYTSGINKLKTQLTSFLQINEQNSKLYYSVEKEKPISILPPLKIYRPPLCSSMGS